MLQGVLQMLPKVEDLPTSTFLDTCNVHGLLNAVQLFRTLSENKRLCTTLRVADKIIFVSFCFVCLFVFCLPLFMQQSIPIFQPHWVLSSCKNKKLNAPLTGQSRTKCRRSPFLSIVAVTVRPIEIPSYVM